MKSTFVTEPYLLSLTPDCEMQVLFFTLTPKAPCVFYGKNFEKQVDCEIFEIKGLKKPDATLSKGLNPALYPDFTVYQCVATVKGTAGEVIPYYCSCNGERTKDYSFHLAPRKGEDFRFIQVSDLQGKNPCEKTLYLSGCHHPDFILYAGDAVTNAWNAYDWFDLDDGVKSREEAGRAFFPCMQQGGEARLMPYAPTFFCPGNHEVDDLRYGLEKDFGAKKENYTWAVMTQIFRPLYPEAQDNYGTGAKRWYSVDYGDLHIVSLSVMRWAMWEAEEWPGWQLFDEIDKDSVQYEWLENDLKATKQPYKWVIEHWHLLNHGRDVQVHLCQPVEKEGKMVYPHDGEGDLMALFAKYHVNAVSFGHSHVYERYLHEGVNYIEAAYFGVCYRGENELPHPSGLLPVVNDNSHRSFLVVEKNNNGMTGKGYYADGKEELFDEYPIA